ncbi:putative mechanosensitive channel protein [Citrobacter braakii]|nr:putative mechanosensitive channel protein [Citrobacter braakii]
MAQLRVHRMRYEDLLNKQPQLRQIHQADGQPLTAEQSSILNAQLRTQRELLNSLLQGGDTLILELTKLKVSNSQLEDALKEVNEATHRYLFWTSDVSPISLSWPVDIVQDLRRLISLDTFNQLGKASIMMLTSKETLLPLFAALVLVGFSLSSRKHFTRFLERSSCPGRESHPGPLLADDTHGVLVDTRRFSVAGAVGNARLRIAGSLALSISCRYRRWRYRHGAHAVGSNDLRHLCAPQRSVHCPLWLAA